MNSEKPASNMKIYTIAFTRQGAKLQEDVKTALQSMPEADVKTHLTPRLMEKIESEKASTEEIDQIKSRHTNAESGSLENEGSVRAVNLSEFTEEAFAKADQIIYIGAAGIAVRAIAPHIVSKDRDPGVTVMDELGKFVIPILSGHIGGANDMAQMLAQMLGSRPVITTATDINGKLAIDTWAVKHNMTVANIEAIKHISAAVLENQKIGIYTDSKSGIIKSQIQELQSLYGNFVKLDFLEDYLPGCEAWRSKDMPGAKSAADAAQNQKLENLVVISNHADSGLRAGSSDADEAAGIALDAACISAGDVKTSSPNILHLIPVNVFVGIGCRKNKAPEDVEKLFLDTLEELKLDIRSVKSINTVDLKKNEEALLKLSHKYGKKLNTFTAQELSRAEDYSDYEFSESELVKRTTGVGNICERAAVIGAGGFMDTLNPKVRLEQKNSADKSGKARETEYDSDYMEISMLKMKTKRDGVTIAFAILN